MMIQAAFAAVATLGTCSSLPPGDIKDPRYWGDYFLDKYETEREASLANIEAGPAPILHQRTVLLITGVTIPAEWFGPIKVRLERDGFNVVVWEPPALLSGDLFTNADRLATVIDDIRAQTGEEKIDILAECTGGLLARHYIQSMHGDRHVARMVTFISPQHGVPKAAEARLLVPWEALEGLTPGSSFLDTVNEATLPSTVAFTSIYTCTDEYIQPYETSIIPGATNIGLGCDGHFVGHYQFFYDPEIYMVMHDQLVTPEDFDPNAPPPMTTPPGDDPTTMNPGDDTTPEGGACSSGGSSSGALLVVGAMLALRAARRRVG